MAASTRSRVSGATLGEPLMTRDTVWWETPARAATSDMTSGRGAASGCTGGPPSEGCGCSRVCEGRPGAELRRGVPPLNGGRRSARGAGPPLVVDVEGHCQQQHQALDHGLDGLVDAHQLHAVAHDADEQTTDDGAHDGADTAGDRSATDETGGDGVELERQTGRR